MAPEEEVERPNAGQLMEVEETLEAMELERCMGRPSSPAHRLSEPGERRQRGDFSGGGASGHRERTRGRLEAGMDIRPLVLGAPTEYVYER